MAKEKNDDFSSIEVEDGDGYSSQQKLSKEQIILKALQRCMDEGAKEMSNGGVVIRIVDGVRYEYPSLNQKEVFLNSIKMFWHLMKPMIMSSYNKLYKEEMGDFTEILVTLQKSYTQQLRESKDRYLKHKNLGLLNSEKQDLQLQLLTKEVELYRQQLDFGILVIERENWFGENYA